jgi:hypothetical protein
MEKHHSLELYFVEPDISDKGKNANYEVIMNKIKIYINSDTPALN